MKVNSVQETAINNNKYNKNGVLTPSVSVRQNSANYNNLALSQGTSFKGGIDPASCVIDFWAAIARGGLAASFTVQDMFGTNFPRTFAALDRNKDITGKNNYKAAVEVMIREFTTGPSMFIVPAIVLAAISKASGDANKVPTDNINSLCEVMKGTIDKLNHVVFKDTDFAKMTTEEANEALVKIKGAFYEDVLKSIFGQYTKDLDSIDIDEYVKLMLKAEDPSTPKRNFFMSMFKIKAKKFGKEVDAKDEILSQLCSKFADDKKLNTKDWDNFLSASILKDGKQHSIGDIMTDMKNFSTDFGTQYLTAQRYKIGNGLKNIPANFIENFKNMRIGTRCLANVLMVVATGLFMCFIPKLYTRNETNPETDAIYAQVNKQRKGPSK